MDARFPPRAGANGIVTDILLAQSRDLGFPSSRRPLQNQRHSRVSENLEGVSRASPKRNALSKPHSISPSIIKVEGFTKVLRAQCQAYVNANFKLEYDPIRTRDPGDTLFTLSLHSGIGSVE